ncbi:hypothetical protein EYZ11_008389 [Aspergillus tanneri]|uniref:Uncharacterized protein n=1 Tax=Aspergillus tanneri TaxID=1220188 RepID=A0A4V6RQR6_9EURO|nr:hypothetical protein EYZ11_008389 [Aspergillus tanneri]
MTVFVVIPQISARGPAHQQPSALQTSQKRDSDYGVVSEGTFASEGNAGMGKITVKRSQ